MSKFSQLEAQLSSRPGVTSPGGLAAFIGRKKEGDRAFNAKAAAGRKKHTPHDVARQLAGK